MNQNELEIILHTLKSVAKHMKDMQGLFDCMVRELEEVSKTPADPITQKG